MPRTKKQPTEAATETTPEDRMEQIIRGSQIGSHNPDAEDENEEDEDEDEEEDEEESDDAWDEDDEDEEEDEDDDIEDWDKNQTIDVLTDSNQPSSFSPSSKPAKSESEPVSEHDTLKTIAEAEQKCSLTEARVSIMRGNLKRIKKEYDGHVITLRKLCAALKKDTNRPLFNQPKAASVAATSIVDLPTSDNSIIFDPQQPASEPTNAWRSVPLVGMPLEGIKGLGPKKIETLVRACPNMGEFEDLRGGKGLTSLEGIGLALASELENAMMTWLAKNRDAAVIAAARGEAIPAEFETINEPSDEPVSLDDL